MKIKSIDEKLNNYADSLKLKDEILSRAYEAMDEKRTLSIPVREKSRRGFWIAFSSVAAAAAVVFVVLLGSFLDSFLGGIGGGGGTTPTTPYSLNSLQKQSVSFESFNDLTDVLFLDDKVEQVDSRHFVYVNESNEIYTARAIYRMVRDSNVDEIEIISDLKNNLSDFENKPSENNEIIRDYDSYKNGEYYSYFAVLKSGTTYYVSVTSPSRYAGEYYENILLNYGE